MKQSTYTWSTPFFDIEFVDIRRAAGQGRRGTAKNQIGLELLNIKMIFSLVLSNHHKILDAHMVKVTIAFR